MSVRVNINPEIITSAIVRAGFAVEEFILKNTNVDKWLKEERQPTVKQLEAFSKKVHIPFGYLLLDELPEEEAPIPFFRTGRGQTKKVSLAIYDTVLLLQDRQDWLSEHLQENGEDPLPFVGQYDVNTDPDEIVASMRATLNLPENWASDCKDWETALGYLTQSIEEAGIVVTFNGVFANNGKRPLDPAECRGFVLIDEYVPFLFINNKDAKAAQMFTLAHELAHIWLGVSAGFDIHNIMPSDDLIEVLCDKVAAEFLGILNFTEKSISKSKYFSALSPLFFGYLQQAVRENQISHLEAYRLAGINGNIFQKALNE